MRLTWLLVTLAGCASLDDTPRLVDDGPGQVPSGLVAALALPRYPAGAPWRLADERGRVVLLAAWATWCEPCRDSLPLYHDLDLQFSARGLRVYAVNVDAEPAVVGPFLEEAKVRLPVLLDPGARQTEAVLKLRMMPTSYLFDRRGALRATHEGFDEGQFGTWLQEIEHLLGEAAR